MALWAFGFATPRVCEHSIQCSANSKKHSFSVYFPIPEIERHCRIAVSQAAVTGKGPLPANFVVIVYVSAVPIGFVCDARKVCVECNWHFRSFQQEACYSALT